MLQLKNIFKSYTTGDFTQVALDGVSLKFRKSEFVAILGPSGSGKTTCLNIIGGLDRYDKGDLTINGKSTKDFKDGDWDAYRNNSVGFVFQNYNLIPHLSIVENVELGMTLSGVPAAERRQRALHVLERVGLHEHVHKNPNQLSGGQMQRVAIARALANDPDIILADEPTGALDTQTSVQIMELIKEIAKEKLVIMVTHNVEIANQFADRIVKFRDGEVVSDSNPLDELLPDSGFSLKKTGMKFQTALKLSGRNIATKKWRTALTSFASSIGIIGIALVLSLSNGFDKQISSFESNTLSGYPITITKTTMDMNSTAMREQRNGPFAKAQQAEARPTEAVIYPHDSSADRVTHTNIFTDQYVQYLEGIDPSLLAGVSYTRLVNMNLLRSDGKVATAVNTSLINFVAYPTNLNPAKPGYVEGSYDLLAGAYPTQMTDLVMIVDSQNQLDTTVLQALGMDYQAANISFNDIIGTELKVIPNDDYYLKRGAYFTVNGTADDLSKLYDSKDAITLHITGIIRPNAANDLEILPAGVSYSDQLAQFFIANAKDSAIVKAQQAADYNVLTGQPFALTTQSSGSNRPGNIMGGVGGGSSRTVTKEAVLSTLGADATPYMVTIYPSDFTAKDQVLSYLSAWNVGKSDEDTVVYTDLASTITDLAGGIMDGITMVLVAFAAISLVVSLIMIGIITYISVLERTREIGVLRALGARKKDITRVFNAETFIIGTCSGLLGIGIAYLLTFPINLILKRLTELDGVAQLNPLHAILLVIVSVSLTMLGGLIPARMAAQRDPVEALRAE